LLHEGDLGLDALLALGKSELLLVVGLLGSGGGSAHLGVAELVIAALLVGVGADGSVGLRVHILDVIGGDFGVNVALELLLVGLLIFFHEVLHVLADVGTVDVVTVFLGVRT